VLLFFGCKPARPIVMSHASSARSIDQRDECLNRIGNASASSSNNPSKQR
jgi:hypothetical protein